MRLPHFCLFIAVASMLSGCSWMTAQGRQERAYNKYVRRTSSARSHQQSRFKSGGAQMPVRRASAESGPETTVQEGPQMDVSSPGDAAAQ